MDETYRTRITGVGPQAAELAAYQILILFAHGAPPELAEISLLHEPDRIAQDDPLVQPGDRVRLGSEVFTVTAVGEVANRNLRQLGHAVFKFTGLAEPEMPGDLILEAGPVPHLEAGATVAIQRSTEPSPLGAGETAKEAFGIDRTQS